MTQRPPRLPRVSIVIPARNEAATIGQVVAGIRAVLGDSARILVVDDGSTDGTGAAAAAAGAEVVRNGQTGASSRTPGAEVGREAGPGGKGSALRAGFALASGPLVATIDADGQDDPADLLRLVEEAEAGWDMVIGSRFLGTFGPGAISPVNRLGTRFFNRLVNALYGGRITDSQAGVRCFRKELLERLELESTEYEIETEMLVKAMKSGARIREVPATRNRRKSGRSSFARVRHGLRILKVILENRWG